ncbi:hypothetical protein BB561_003295 [Smittium simulii]|uniref:Uncharacterized protein n=1 Tax=Smittium simulii TaxID=133385 RepID=A0A2T9YM74_9FUNG|nr:hypothetical protein BB561_003295 [Smittium simulii]
MLQKNIKNSFILVTISSCDFPKVLTCNLFVLIDVSDFQKKMYRVNVGILALCLSTICLTSNYAKVDALAVNRRADKIMSDQSTGIFVKRDESGAEEAPVEPPVDAPEMAEPPVHAPEMAEPPVHAPEMAEPPVGKPKNQKHGERKGHGDHKGHEGHGDHKGREGHDDHKGREGHGDHKRKKEDKPQKEAGTSTESFTPELNMLQTDGIPDEP